MKYIVGNWKMNKNKEEIKKFLDEVANFDFSHKAGIAVPHIYLDFAKNYNKNNKLIISAQNVNENKNGAFTGEISISMLKDNQINSTIIGHSERREYYNETDESINKKVLSCLENDIEVILAVGENLEQRKSGEYIKIIEEQLKKDLANVNVNNLDKIVIAYEPIWAIGTGKTATSDQANEVCEKIKNWLVNNFGDSAKEIIIMYGGSINPENAKEILNMPSIDGGLVGGASLQADSFMKLFDI